MSRETVIQDLVHASFDAIITAGIIDSISTRWPEDVQDRWYEGLEEDVRRAERRLEEYQEFASTWDDLPDAEPDRD